MNFQFFSTPKPKKFNYKPRFQKPENEEETQTIRKRNDEFAVRLHESWEKRRKKKS